MILSPPSQKKYNMNFNQPKFIKSLLVFIFLTLSLSEFSEVYSSSDTLNHPVLFPGWPKSFRWEILSGPTQSVVLANLDTLPNLEIVAGFPYDSLYVWKYDGTNLNNWPIMVQPESAHYEIVPAVGDVDGDGKLDIAVTKWQRGQYFSLLYVFHKDGSIMQGFPVEILGASATAPALYDLNGDGKLEIIASGAVHDIDTLVYVYNYKGEILPGWPQRVANLPYEAIMQQPAVGDLDGDGEPEIVATGSQAIYAWHIDGTPLRGWPVKAEKDFYFGWIHHVVLSDLDNDGYLEVLASAFHDYPIFTGYVAVWRYDGTYMPGFPKYYEVQPNTTPIPGDIDNDGDKEIAFMTGEFLSDPPKPNIHILRIDGTELPGWPIYLEELTYEDLALVDIDGDNSVEIIVRGQNRQPLHRYGRIYAYHKDGTLVPGYPLDLFGWTNEFSPNFGDVNKDGLLDMAMLTQYGSYYVYLFNMNVPYHPDKILWGKLFHDNYNTNNTEFGVIRKKGDFNNSGSPDITDVIFLLNYLFKNGKKPGYPYQADVNCDSRINVSDLIQLYRYLFQNGRPLCSP
jgi:hypothetical protein